LDQGRLIFRREPLIHPEWGAIAELLRSRGIELWLADLRVIACKARARAARYFKNITVSLDVPISHLSRDPRVDALPRYVRAFGCIPLWVCGQHRVTLQRANYRQLPES